MPFMTRLCHGQDHSLEMVHNGLATDRDSNQLEHPSN